MAIAITVAVRLVAVAIAAVVRRLGSVAVGGTDRRMGCRAVALLLPFQLFVDSLLGQSEDLADSIVKSLGLPPRS